jgi:hypothetical protein
MNTEIISFALQQWDRLLNDTNFGFSLNRFYGILGELETKIGGVRKLADCVGNMNWPSRGVYFFFDQGENRSDSGDGSRVVRVGTHALRSGSKTKLWTRLSQHRGVLNTVAEITVVRSSGKLWERH